jgi:hypothetical protein
MFMERLGMSPLWAVGFVGFLIGACAEDKTVSSTDGSTVAGEMSTPDAGDGDDGFTPDGSSAADGAVADGAGSAANIYFSFVINCHDFVNADSSADTLLKAMGIFKKYGVKGDFYLTASLAQTYEAKRPDVLAALKQDQMGLGFHQRAPHPYTMSTTNAYQALRQASDPVAAVYAVESQRLDLVTGELIPGEPGGLLYLKSIFGYSPTIASPSYLSDAKANEKPVRDAAIELYYNEGARMIVVEHEGGTPKDVPYRYDGKLLRRPSHFSVTRWDSSDGTLKDQFWWNMMSSPQAADYDPIKRFEALLTDYPADSRPYFAQTLIHENNYYMANTPWGPIYYEDKDKTVEKKPPFDLSATASWIKTRSQSEQGIIWQKYEDLVAYLASHPRVKIVIAQDVVKMATP